MHTKWFLIFTYKRLKKKKNKEKLSVYILTGNKKFFFIKHAQEYLQFEMIQCSVHKQKTNIAVVTNTTTILNDNAVFSWQMTDIVEMFFRSDNLLQSAKVLTIVDWVKWWNGRSLISLFTLNCLISPCCKQTKILIDWVLTLDSPAIMTVSAAYIPQANRTIYPYKHSEYLVISHFKSSLSSQGGWMTVTGQIKPCKQDVWLTDTSLTRKLWL